MKQKYKYKKYIYFKIDVHVPTIAQQKWCKQCHFEQLKPVMLFSWILKRHLFLKKIIGFMKDQF